MTDSRWHARVDSSSGPPALAASLAPCVGEIEGSERSGERGRSGGGGGDEGGGGASAGAPPKSAKGRQEESGEVP